MFIFVLFFFFQAEDGIRDLTVTGVQTCALPISILRRVLVTAGGTQESIDPVRYITNHSSGKMGYALAEAARDRGASVVLVTTPTALRRPAGVRVVDVRQAREMLDVLRSEYAQLDALIMVAAVADFAMPAPSAEKIKR